MANVPYNPTPEIAPRTEVPDDYQHIQANPAQFGGLIAQGEERLGEGATKAGQFFGQVQTDDAVNGALTSVNKVMSNYLSLRGADALNAQKDTQDQIDAAFKNGRDGLSTPLQQHEYDQTVRTYQQRYVAEKLASHADQQAKAYAVQTNTDSFGLALDGVTNVADEPDKVEAFRQDARRAAVRNVQASGNGSDPAAVNAAVTRADQAVFKTQAETIAVKDPSRALALVESHKTELGDAYAPLAEQFRARADRQVGITAATNAVGTAAPRPTTAVADPSAVIKHFEGFKEQPYWDVNHWRVGYGSDTVTRADGTVEPVTAMTQISKADADRDLQRRVGLSQNQVQASIGPTSWASLSAPAQASLTSVAYNYGHLPNSVAEAARTGDPVQIAHAISSLGQANGGVNLGRRTAEANNVLGHFGLSGVESGGPAPTMTMPQQNSGEAQTNPAYSPITTQTQLTKADAFHKVLTDPTLQNNPVAMSAALSHVNQVYTAQEISEASDAKAKKAASDQAAGAYTSAIMNGQTKDIVHKIADDPNLNWEAKHALWAFAKNQADSGDVNSYSPGYTQAYDAILLPAGDPNRIADPVSILRRAGPGGDLTPKEADKLLKVMQEIKKSPDQMGIEQTKASLINYAKSKLSFDQTMLIPGMPPLRDPKGAQIFNAQFMPKFESAYDKWVSGGNDPFKFLTQENIDKMVVGMRSKSEMQAAKIAATGEGGPDMPPPAPQGVDQNGWHTLISNPPMTSTGKRASPAQWGQALKLLNDNPTPQTIAAFDKWFGAGGYKAKDVLDNLKPKADNGQ